MKITYLNQELDPNKEHELFKEDNLGFDITVQYSIYQAPQTFYNCTEFHWRYNESSEWDKDKRVAFESDIHCTGSTRSIKDIDNVIIVEAEVLHDNF